MNKISVFDWTIYRHLFSDAAMEQIFSEANTIACWVDVEKAIAIAQAKTGIIPPDHADTIASSLNAETVDLERLRIDTREVGRPVSGFIKQMSEQVGGDAAHWVHYGVTTYDLMDTGRTLQIRQGLDLIEDQLKSLIRLYVQFAQSHRSTLMIGRTNNLHALPKSFGAKLAVWIEEAIRHLDRIEELRQRVLVVQFGGAVGSLASLGDKGLEFRQEVAKELDLGTIRSNWHNARDSIVEAAQTLGLICATLARIGQGVNAMESTELGELSETGKPGRGRSTTMAHKANPRAAEYTEAIARLGRQRSNGLIEVMGQDHDRCGGTWIAEWALLPETFLLTSGALSWALDLFNRLEVNAERMETNVGITNGLILTERFTLALATKLNKTEARSILDSACEEARKSQQSLPDILKAMPCVNQIMSDQEIDELSNPHTYLGSGPEILDNVLELAEAKINTP